MIVSIGSDAGAVLGESDDLTRLHVEATDDDARTDAELRASGLGYLDDDHAWLSVTALREHAAPGVQAGGRAADWPVRYDAMIGYAIGKGWCTTDGTHVRAHIERVRGEAPDLRHHAEGDT